MDLENYHADPFHGNCPTCHQHNDSFVVGREHYFFCDEHKTVWAVPERAGTVWRAEGDQQKAVRVLEGYTRVKPWFPEATYDNHTEAILNRIEDYTGHPVRTEGDEGYDGTMTFIVEWEGECFSVQGPRRYDLPMAGALATLVGVFGRCES